MLKTLKWMLLKRDIGFCFLFESLTSLFLLNGKICVSHRIAYTNFTLTYPSHFFVNFDLCRGLPKDEKKAMIYHQHY